MIVGGSKRVIVALRLPGNWSIRSSANWPLHSKGTWSFSRSIGFPLSQSSFRLLAVFKQHLSQESWRTNRNSGSFVAKGLEMPKQKVWKKRKEPPLKEKLAKASALAITRHLRFQARKIHGQAIIGSGTEVLANAMGRSAWNQILLWEGQLSQWQCVLCCIQMLKLGQPYKQHMQQIRLMEIPYINHL